MNYDINVHSRDTQWTEEDHEATVNFLYTHLEQYGDEKKDISAAIDYVMSEDTPGGYIVEAKDGEEIVGAVVVNRTGMKGYIPGNILVYIAVHGKTRGRGLGGALMKKALARAEGGMALHVEPDNPAKRLYERLGFTNKYLEMRYEGNN